MEKSKTFGSFFADASGGEGDRCNYPTRLDTYGCGCFHDCKYCYAKSLLDFRKNWHPDNPSVASTADISKALKKVRKGQILRLGGMTDCFQPIERVYVATRQAIQMMNARGIGYLIVTKSALVADKSYTRIMDKDLAHIQISVTSTSDESNFLGERASKPSDRLRAAETLFNQGFDVSLRVLSIHTKTGRNRGSEGFGCPQVPSRVSSRQQLHKGMARGGGIFHESLYPEVRRISSPAAMEEAGINPAVHRRWLRADRMRGRASSLQLLAAERQCKSR